MINNQDRSFSWVIKYAVALSHIFAEKYFLHSNQDWRVSLKSWFIIYINLTIKKVLNQPGLDRAFISKCSQKFTNGISFYKNTTGPIFSRCCINSSSSFKYSNHIFVHPTLKKVSLWVHIMQRRTWPVKTGNSVSGCGYYLVVNIRKMDLKKAAEFVVSLYGVS